MSFSLKNLFVEENDIPVKNETTPVPEVPTKTASYTPNNLVTTPTSASPKQAFIVDDKTKTILEKAIADKMGDSLGYLQFKKALVNMASIIPDEKTRFISSYIPNQTLGMTKKSLLESINQIKDILSNEMKEFEQTLGDMENTNISKNEKELVQLEQMQKDLAKQIEDISKQIGILQTQKTEKENILSQEKEKINTIKQNFTVTYQAYVSEIDNDAMKINTYIGA